jgi:hypothetical protein
MHGVLNVDEIKNLLYSFVVLYETNILSLINQCLDNYYQIKTKVLQCSTVNREHPIWASKRGLE